MISDEIHADFVHPEFVPDGRRHLPWSRFGTGRWAIVTSASKSFNFPALSGSYGVIGDPDDHAEFMRRMLTAEGLASPAVLVLCERLGDRGRGVHSIEVDPAMAAMAATHLGDTGYEPHLRVGDGEHGWQGGEPFDRIVVTCSLRRMPYAFIEQVRPRRHRRGAAVSGLLERRSGPAHRGR